ncbi:MAG: hypothetical protein ACPGLV_03015 [Bacteroidia bacterium]
MKFSTSVLSFYVIFATITFSCSPKPKSKPSTVLQQDNNETEIHATTEKPDSAQELIAENKSAALKDQPAQPNTIINLIEQGKGILMQWDWENLDNTYELLFPGIYFYPDSSFFQLPQKELLAFGTSEIIKTTCLIDTVTGLEYIDGLHTGYSLKAKDSILCFITKGGSDSIAFAKLNSESIIDPNDAATEGNYHYKIEFNNAQYEFALIESFEKSGLIDFKDSIAYRAFYVEKDYGENDVFNGLRKMLWAGDINHDGHLDLLFEKGGYCDPHYVLFIGDEKGDYNIILLPDQKGEPCGC